MATYNARTPNNSHTIVVDRKELADLLIKKFRRHGVEVPDIDKCRIQLSDTFLRISWEDNNFKDNTRAIKLDEKE